MAHVWRNEDILDCSFCQNSFEGQSIKKTLRWLWISDNWSGNRGFISIYRQGLGRKDVLGNDYVNDRISKL